MTAALDLIREAEAQGIRLLVEGAKLKWRSKSPIRDELLGRLREHKPERVIEQA
jgi:TubC N-terminal docking domain